MSMGMDKEELKTIRGRALHTAKKRTLFQLGDKRIFSPRMCVVCGKVLSTYMMYNGKYRTSTKHYYIHLHGKWEMKVSLCHNINSCYKELNNK